MVSLCRAALTALALIALSVSMIGMTAIAFAQSSTSLSGRVIADGKPVANATVTAAGPSGVLRAVTRSDGSFTFAAINVGTYRVSTPGPQREVSATVDVTSNGAAVTLDTSTIAEIGRVLVSQLPVNRSSGSDVVVNGGQLAHAAVSNSLPDILVQSPAAARGSNGQIHMNGDHNGINYVVDGVQIPEGLNRVLGNEIDPSDIGFAELIEGAYPAQYGDKFAGVLNISTRSKTGPAGGTFDQRVGSYNLYDTVLGFHTPVATNASLYVGARFFHDSLALDPPVLDPVHDAGSITS